MCNICLLHTASSIYNQRLKGKVSCFWFFPIRAVLNFFENLQRYLQLKVHHRCHWHWWQMGKISNQKFFYYFFWTPLGSRVTFFFKLIFVVFSLIIVATGINNTSETGGKICRRCRWCTLTCEYLRECLKKFGTVLMEYSGAEGETDSWKKPEAKNFVSLSL